MKDLGDTANLRAIAPTLAELPRWTRRIAPAAAWIGVTILFAAASGLFWRTVTLSTEYALVHKDVALLDSKLQGLDDLEKSLAQMKPQVAQLVYDHAVAEWVLQADYNRRHRLPVPPPPQPPTK